jgi:hypothetical protein
MSVDKYALWYGVERLHAVDFINIIIVLLSVIL